MDAVIDELTQLCQRLTFKELPDEAVAAATQRLVDTLACAIGAVECETADIGRQIAPRLDPGQSELIARSIGEGQRRTTVESAAYVNSSMIRYLDFNDSFRGQVHASDLLGAVVALADALHVNGEDLVTAVVAGYEVATRSAAATNLGERGWDQGFAIGLGVAAGASVLLGLDREQTRNALSIAAVSNVPLRATRAGQLSMWKGSATAYAGRNALFGTFLAAKGMTGPEAPIEGRHGLQDLITGPFELEPFTGAPDSFLIRQLRTKYWPVCSHLQAAIWAAIELRDRVEMDDIATIDIATSQSGWQGTGKEPEKWDPTTRETADHSMPYVFIRALQAGELDGRAFEPSSYLEQAVRPALAKVSVHVDDDIEARHREDVVLRATVTTTSGESFVSEIVNALGHEKNPVSPAQIDEKFLRLAAVAVGRDRAEEALTFWSDIAAADDIGGGIDLLAVESVSR